MVEPATVASFTDSVGFTLDDFQRDGIQALVTGSSVLVAAPTGAGKTVVGNFACHVAVTEGGRAFYTTPIKALSNQKFRDLVATYGEGSVGLLTGDRAVNGGAPIVVMTTEVLRNMIYERSSALDALRYVVLDEVHYLADRERGAVWEEIIIHLPRRVAIAALSATVSNAETFGAWLNEVREGCATVVAERRPVPLRHHYFVNNRIYPTFRAGGKQGADRHRRELAAQGLAGVPNPDVVMLERQASTRNRVSNRGRRQAPSVRLRWPSRPEVVEELARRRWLPAIMFVFSRQGCERAVEELIRSGVRLTSSTERADIAVIVDTLMAEVPAEELEVLDFPAWRSMLLEGVAAHHAGMVPAFKECVEQLFQRGLLKVVVATETLALGINMPARTVVIERLEKWDGDRHVLLTPGEYTQLTGRAGRRGIDDVGHAVVLHQRDVDFKTVAGLVSTRAYPLVSSFNPSYNMAINLLRHHDREESERLLASSFAQYVADASVSRHADRLAELTDARAGYSRNLVCEAGDWQEYWQLRRSLTAIEREHERVRKEQRRDALLEGLADLQPGDVIAVPAAEREQLVAVIGVQLSKSGTPIAQVVTAQGALSRVGPRELTRPPVLVDRVNLPRSGNPRQREFRREIAQTLRQVTRHRAQENGADEQAPNLVSEQVETSAGAANGHLERQQSIQTLRQQLRAHPCHSCDDRTEHEVWQHRVDELDAEVDRLSGRVRHATGSLVRRFTRIRGILTQTGYLIDDRPTSDGLRLARIYADADLLIAESLRHGLFDELRPEELVAMAAIFLYEPRSDDFVPAVEQPTDRLQRVATEIEAHARRLRHEEKQAGLPTLRELDGGFSAAAYRWAQGASLDESLGDLELTGGDFVRMIKQIADLLGQMRHADSGQVASAASAAIDAIRRGIVEL